MIRRLRRRGTARSGSDRGSAALELIVLAPVLFALIALIIAAGRISIANSSVTAAARDAARQASIALNPSAAQLAGDASGRAALADDGLHCVVETVNVDTGEQNDTGFAIQAGTPATVSATVSCTVPLSDLALPGLPGSHTITATFDSPLDVYRQR